MSPNDLKILSIVGTRPEAVKMAPVINRLQATPAITSIVCATAQHREMMDQVLALFEIQPDIDLDLMRDDQQLAELTARIFQGLDPVFTRERPDWVLVQGDTTTVVAAGLLAYYHRAKVGHVEAGLRTGDKWQPFPEEVNRRIAGVVADLHFAPTGWARDNLLREGVSPEHIVVSGNPVIDAMQEIARRPYDFSSGPLAFLPDDCRIILLTAHRRENFGLPLKNVFLAVRELAMAHPEDVHVVYPVHLNPNVYGPAHKHLDGVPNISLLDPLDYLAMVHLIGRSYLVLTDSGGLQEEAPAVGTPVLVLREVTERPEAVEAGTARLVGTGRDEIIAETTRLLEDPAAYDRMAKAKNPFGDGHAAERIVQALVDYSG